MFLRALASVRELVKTSAFVRNLAAVSSARVVSILVNLGMLGYAARKLGPASYGRYTYAVSFIAYAGTLLAPGLLTWGTRRVAQHREEAGKTLVVVNGTQVLLSLVGYAAVWLLSEEVADIEQRAVIRIVGLSLFSIALSADWIFAGLEMNRYSAPVTVATAVCSACAQLAWVNTSDDLIRFSFIAPIVSIFGTLATYGMLLRVRGLVFVLPKPSDFKIALYSSASLTISAILITMLHHATALQIQLYMDTQRLAYFASALRILEALSLVPGLLLSVFVPRLSRLVFSSPQLAVREAHLMTRCHIVAGCFFGGALMTEASSIIALLYGSRYSAAVEPLRIMSIGAAFNFALCGYTSALIAYRQDRAMMAVVGASATWAIGGGFVAIPLLEVLGAALVYAGIDLVGWLVSISAYRTATGSLLLRAWIAPIAGAVAMIACGSATTLLQVPLPLRVALECLAFFAFAFPSFRTLLAEFRFRRSGRSDSLA